MPFAPTSSMLFVCVILFCPTLTKLVLASLINNKINQTLIDSNTEFMWLVAFLFEVSLCYHTTCAHLYAKFNHSNICHNFNVSACYDRLSKEWIWRFLCFTCTTDPQNYRITHCCFKWDMCYIREKSVETRSIGLILAIAKCNKLQLWAWFLLW